MQDTPLEGWRFVGPDGGPAPLILTNERQRFGYLRQLLGHAPGQITGGEIVFLHIDREQRSDGAFVPVITAEDSPRRLQESRPYLGAEPKELDWQVEELVSFLEENLLAGLEPYLWDGGVRIVRDWIEKPDPWAAPLAAELGRQLGIAVEVCEKSSWQILEVAQAGGKE